MRYRLIFISLLISSLIIPFGFRICSSEGVDEKLVLTGALYHAQEVFGPLVHFHTQQFLDLDDIPQAYVFILCHPENPVLDLVLSEDEILSGFLSDYEQSGIVTVVGGANKSHVPVIEMHRGLPDYILNFLMIKRKIKEKTSNNNWNVVGYLYPAPLEFWLKFQSSNSLETLFVRSSDISIMDPDIIEQLWCNPIRRRTVNPDKARAERTRRKWDFVEDLVIRAKIFMKR